MTESPPTRIALINNVHNGGETYLAYLKFAIESLPEHCEVQVIQGPRERVGISPEQTAAFLGLPVTEAPNYAVLGDLQNVDVVISNDAFVGRFFDDSIFAIYISHGNSAMPANSEHYYAEETAFWDALLVSSKAALEMVARGIGLYRCRRKSQAIPMAPNAIRSDVRKTLLCPIAPLKRPRFSAEVAEQLPEGRPEGRPGGAVIGILPTSPHAIRPGASLYNSLGIIEAIKGAFPTKKVVFRPYMTDRAHPQIKDLVEKLKLFPQLVDVDLSGKSSTAFYDDCDVMITDGSTGGVSFMLHGGMPPIYYLPQALVDSDRIVSWFVEAVKGRVLLAHSIPELVACISRCLTMSHQECVAFFQNFCAQDLFLEQSNTEVFTQLVDPSRREASFTGVDYSGNRFPAMP
jgi:hypothetical protein